jgi:hypothetical protein
MAKSLTLTAEQAAKFWPETKKLQPASGLRVDLLVAVLAVGTDFRAVLGLV